MTTPKTTADESKPFSCRLDDGTVEGVIVEGLVIKSVENKHNTFDVQVFIKTRFYTFCIAQQKDRHYLMRLVKVHDRTGTFLSLKTLLVTSPKLERVFEQVLQSLLDET